MVKEGYKETEIGVIPADWAVANFGDKVKIYRGGSPRPITNYLTTSDAGVNWIKIGDVKSGEKYINKTEEKIIPEGVSKSREVFSGDFILSNSMSYGRPYILNIDGCIHDGWLTIQSYDEFFDKEYLYYLLSSDMVFAQYISMAAGSSVKNLNKDKVSSLIVAIPTKSEQEKIAEALSDMDNLISSLEKLIEKKKSIKQGAMHELLTGKKRLPGFSGAWKEFCIGKIGEFYGGLSGKTKNDFNCGNAHYITFLNVLSNVKIDTSILASVNVKETENQNAVKKGDLFFNTSSETPEEVGMCAVLDEEIENTYLNSFCFGFRMKNNEHNPIFLSYYLNSSIGRKIMSTLAQGATRYNLSKNNFAETIIELPIKEEQTAIASILSDMDAEITALEQKLEKCQKLKQGMMQQLLTGKIRLV